MKIGDFLLERKDRLKPDEANASGLSRIKKIDFSGNIHIDDGKKTNTGMILVKKNDLVISGINVAKGALAIYKGDNDVLATIHYSSYSYDINKIDVEYLMRFVKSPIFKDILQTQTRGGIKTEIKAKTFLKLEINLPDIENQRNIIERIKSMKNEINQVENINLTNQDLEKKLRQSILQDAIQGKFIPQDPNDEPASKLLERIQAEKEQLIKEKKIKKGKDLAPITEEEKPFDLPKGWEWVRLGEISKNIHYGYTASAENIDTGVKMLRITDIQDNQVNRSTVPFCSISKTDLEKMKLQINDILIARTGGTVGKTFLIKNVDDVSVFASYLIRVILLSNNLPEYIKLFLESPSYWNQLIAGVTGSAQPNVNAVTLGNLILPLPPLAEQHRIVAKVDELMGFCDGLEEQITEAKENGERLMESVLGEVFR